MDDRLEVETRIARRVLYQIEGYDLGRKNSFIPNRRPGRWQKGGRESQRGTRWVAVNFSVRAKDLDREQRQWCEILGRHLRAADAAISLCKVILRHYQRGYGVPDYSILVLSQLQELLGSPLPPCPICLPEESLQRKLWSSTKLPDIS